MPKTRKEKQEVVEKLSTKLAASEALLVLSPKSINPNEAATLKMQLDEVGGEYHLIKNSLFRRALVAAGIEPTESADSGQNAIVFANENSAEAAKVMSKFIKETDKAEFKGGYFAGKSITIAQVQELANLPSRDVLLAQVLATMNAPVTGFVNVLAGNVRSIVTVISAIKDSKEGK